MQVTRTFALALPLVLVAPAVGMADPPSVDTWKIGAGEVGPLKPGVAMKDVPALTGLVVKQEDGAKNYFKMLRGSEHVLTGRADSPTGGKLTHIQVFSTAITTKEGIGPGSKASAVAAAYGARPKDLGGTEGEACFAFSRAAGMIFCFAIDTEQAKWKQVLKRDFPVAYVQVPGAK
jgi:hypothetical protein